MVIGNIHILFPLRSVAATIVRSANYQDFKCLDHLSDLTPDANDHHYKQFSEVFGTGTMDEAMPLLKVLKDHGHKILFNPVKQHDKHLRQVFCKGK